MRSGTLPADLIVVGSVGRAGGPGFSTGNTAEEVLQTAVAPVLGVKPAGFSFARPVTGGDASGQSEASLSVWNR